MTVWDQADSAVWTVWDQADSAVDSGIVTRFVAVMVSPFATRTVGPFLML